MQSSLTNACTIKIQNFEGPFDLLFHLLEKNQINIYDIPINDITDQYMDYLFTMQELDMEIASEFLLMAATLLHIKSRMLLPDKKEKQEEEVDPREELVLKLIEYKKYKQFSGTLRENEKIWEHVYYKLPDVVEFTWEEETLELSPDELKKIYSKILDRNKRKQNNTKEKMAQIIQHEKVSLKSKMKEVVKALIAKAMVRFTDIFSLKHKSRMEVITGFMAILELTKLKKVQLDQQKQFGEIVIHRSSEELDIFDIEKVAGDD